MDANAEAIIAWQCTQVTHAFAYHIDHGEFEEVVNLWTPDGVFDRLGEVLQGQEAIRTAMRDRPKVTTRHVFTNFHFHRIEEDEAEATVLCMSFHSLEPFDGKPLVYGTAQGRLIEFRERYVRTADGWKFAEHNGQVVFMPEVWP